MISQQVAHHFEARRIGEGKWKAKCPLHQGHSDGSLSIYSADDGKTLIRCWAGCKTEDVLATVGLSWSDLFPQSSNSYVLQGEIFAADGNVSAARTSLTKALEIDPDNPWTQQMLSGLATE